MNDQNKDPEKGHDQFAPGHWTMGRRAFLTYILVICTGLVLFLQACNAQEAQRERQDASATRTHPGHHTARPPIDASTPAKTETATFALG